MFLLSRCQPAYSRQQVLLVPPHWGWHDDCAEPSWDESVFSCVGCSVICRGRPWRNASQITVLKFIIEYFILPTITERNIWPKGTILFRLLEFAFNFYSTDFIFRYFCMNDLIKTWSILKPLSVTHKPTSLNLISLYEQLILNIMDLIPVNVCHKCSHVSHAMKNVCVKTRIPSVYWFVHESIYRL